jgi:hypothetical protein
VAWNGEFPFHSSNSSSPRVIYNTIIFRVRKVVNDMLGFLTLKFLK